MQKIDLSKLTESVGWINRVAEDIRLIQMSGGTFGIIKTEYDHLIDSLDFMVDVATSINLPVTLRAAKQARNAAGNAIITGPINVGQGEFYSAHFGMIDIDILRDSARDIVKSAEAEFADRKAYILDSSNVCYLDTSTLFKGTLDQFPASSQQDIEQAGLCLALGQGTASVFHLMRAMEAMVSQLTAHLGGLTDNPEKAWGPLLNDLDHYIKKLPVSNPAEKAIRDNWSSCHVNLRHVKDATRNATMHPRQFYSPSEAREIFEASRVFIRDLASLIC